MIRGGKGRKGDWEIVRGGRGVHLTLSLALLFLVASCGATERQKRTLYGAALGASIGAISGTGVNGDDDDTELAVGVGAGVGALVGAVLGYYSADDPTQRCWDGSVISVNDQCPPETKTCWDDSVISVNDQCPPETKTCWDDSVISVNDQCPPETKTCCDGSVVGVNEQCPIIRLQGVHFGFDKPKEPGMRTDIKPEDEPVLDEAAQMLMACQDVSILIEGHTCDIGTEAYNQILSERRANAVKDYLVGKGVAADRLETVGRGENDPIAPNEDGRDDPGRKMNRRAELIPQ